MHSQQPPQILIVDDDLQIRTMLARYLGDHGFEVTPANGGQELLRLLDDRRFDAVVLDVMMPGEDGFTLCRRLRATSNIPIILLTARDSATDRVVGLELGADDYVSKPFDPRELLARIRSLLRRSSLGQPATNPKGDRHSFAGWELDLGRRSLISPAGAYVDLTSGEFDLLTAFVLHPQQILSRDRLMDFVHGRTTYNVDRSIDVQVSRLRRKIEADPQEPSLVKTVRNGGYFFAIDVRREHEDRPVSPA